LPRDKAQNDYAVSCGL